MQPQIVTVRQSGPMAVRPFGANAASELLLPSDPHRRYLLIQNNSGADMWIGVGGSAAEDQSLILGSGVYWEPLCVPTDSIYVRSATATNARGIAMFVSSPD